MPRPASGSGRAVVSENPVEVARAERVLDPCCETNVAFAAETGCDSKTDPLVSADLNVTLARRGVKFAVEATRGSEQGMVALYESLV